MRTKKHIHHQEVNGTFNMGGVGNVSNGAFDSFIDLTKCNSEAYIF